MTQGVARRVLTGVAGWAVVLVGLRLTLAAPERCRVPTGTEVRRAAEEAVGWFARNLREDGRWLYAYDRAADRVDPTYNIVRHAGVSLSLAQADRHGIAGARETLDAGLAYALGHLVDTGAGVGFGVEGRDLEAGAAALLASALVERREVTGETVHDGTLRALGRFLAAQVEDDGRVLGWWSPSSGGPVPESTSQYYTGEAFWALARLHTTFPREGWDDPVRRVARYLARERDDREPRFPPVSDHWAAYAYDEIAHWPEGGGLGPGDREYARRQAGLFSVQARWEAQKDGAVTRLTHGADVLAAGVGTWGEGLGALWRASAADPGLADLRAGAAGRLACLSGLLVDRQVGPTEAAAGPRPDATRGAWFSGGRTQMDDQQHALSALLAATAVLEEGG